MKKGETLLSPPLKNISQSDISKDLFERVSNYWHYRKEGDYQKTFQYEYRGFKGEAQDDVYKNYIQNNSKAAITKIDILDVIRESDKDICMNMEFHMVKPNLIGKKSFILKDCWINESENWYHSLKGTLFFKY